MMPKFSLKIDIVFVQNRQNLDADDNDGDI